jgi:hypothetical protein
MKDIMLKLIQNRSISLKNRYTEFNLEQLKKIKKMLSEGDRTNLDSDGIKLFVSYLYCVGYLTKTEREDRYKFPNFETRKKFFNYVIHYSYGDKFDVIKGSNVSQSIYELLSHTSKKELKEKIMNLKLAFKDFLKDINYAELREIFQNENLNHCLLVFLSFLVLRIDFDTEIRIKKYKEEKVEKKKKKKEKYRRFADVFITKNNVALIIQFKEKQITSKGFIQTYRYQSLKQKRKIKKLVILTIYF